MSVSKGLGKGLDALIPKEFDQAILSDNERVHSIYVEKIEPNPEQPRKHFDEQALKELTASIKNHGIVQPLVVTKKGSNYRLVAGERRLRAAKQAGLKEVPAIVRTMKELEELEVSIIENVQRVDLSPLEQALSIERLHDQFSLSYAEIAEKLGKAIPTIHNISRLLQLPEEAKQALIKNEITEGHARAILALKDQPEEQVKLLDAIINQGWSVRQAEQFVAMSRKKAPRKKASSTANLSETAETKNLAGKLKTTVTIRHTKRGGSIQIGFNDDKELKRILESLSS